MIVSSQIDRVSSALSDTQSEEGHCEYTWITPPHTHTIMTPPIDFLCQHKLWLTGTASVHIPWKKVNFCGRCKLNVAAWSSTEKDILTHRSVQFSLQSAVLSDSCLSLIEKGKWRVNVFICCLSCCNFCQEPSREHKFDRQFPFPLTVWFYLKLPISCLHFSNPSLCRKAFSSSPHEVHQKHCDNFTLMMGCLRQRMEMNI